MNQIPDKENYIISQAIKANQKDPFSAKAWIITAKTLYPNNFYVQFEAYNLEKKSNSFEESAKCFNYIYLNFPNQPLELWEEINNISQALRASEGQLTDEQEFYVKMFTHIAYEVQHKILLHTVNHSEENFAQCKLLLQLMKKFPQAIKTHSTQLLELLHEGMTTDPNHYQDMLVEGMHSLIQIKSSEIPAVLIYRIYYASLEYNIKQIFNEEKEKLNNDIWIQIFNILSMCGKLLKWENFLPFNLSWSKDVYWQNILQIVKTNPSRQSDDKQVFFYASTLFLFSLQEYMKNIEVKEDNIKPELILMEGITDNFCSDSMRNETGLQNERPHITVVGECSKEITVAFITAANCWQLLNRNEVFLRDFNNLLLKLPLSSWISSFLFDLAMYLGEYEEASRMITEIQTSKLRMNLQLVNIMVLKRQFTVQGLDYIIQILSDLPSIQGQFNDNIASFPNQQRHILLIPLTQRNIVQYCTRILASRLQRKLNEPNCSDIVMGNLLILAQLEYPKECTAAEHIFSQIKSRRQFNYSILPGYLISIDFIEELMHIWHSFNGEVNFEFFCSQLNTARRISTRGADKGARDDFKHVIKQQVGHSNDDICGIIIKFITSERNYLIQSLF